MVLIISYASEAGQSTFLPLILEKPCSVLCDCCLRIARPSFAISDFILAYLGIVCNVSCFINSILLLLLHSNDSIMPWYG